MDLGFAQPFWASARSRARSARRLPRQAVRCWFPGPSCELSARGDADSLAGVRGLELANVALRRAGPNSLVSQNIFVPESFGEEPQRDGRGARWGPDPP